MQYCITVTINYIIFVLFKLSVFFVYIFSENRCPVTLEDHPVVKDSDTVFLSCSSMASCPLELMLSPVPRNGFKYQDHTKGFTAASFTASWKDDGMEISCQVQFNSDPYLIQKMTLRVECEFRNTEQILMYWFHLVVLFVSLGDGDCVKNFFLKLKTDLFFLFLLDRWA